jgi:hypothetical protein
VLDSGRPNTAQRDSNVARNISPESTCGQALFCAHRDKRTAGTRRSSRPLWYNDDTVIVAAATARV